MPPAPLISAGLKPGILRARKVLLTVSTVYCWLLNTLDT